MCCPLTCCLCAQVKRRVEQDALERAKAQGVPPDAVPRIDGLCVRVVNITDKVVDVKERFHNAFKDRGYPSGFPFKQKVILLFQRIEGVDVLLFIVYVQVPILNVRPPRPGTAQSMIFG